MATAAEGWPLQINNLFIPTGSSTQDITCYRINLKALRTDQCHLFFPPSDCEELFIATVLEHHSFPPSNRQLNGQFHIRPVELDSASSRNIVWCSFPIEFKETCKQIAQVFGFTLKEKECHLCRFYEEHQGSSWKAITLTCPEAENLLMFEKGRLNEQVIPSMIQLAPQIAKYIILGKTGTFSTRFKA